MADRTGSARTELSERNAAELLAGLGVLPRDAEVAITALAGGVANCVLAVGWPGGEVVVKQALPNLRVAADWPFDPARTDIERECLSYLGEILPAGSVPEVVAFDADHDLLVITRAPAGGTVWKQALLAGEVDPAVGAEVGELVGLLHRTSARDPIARERFAAQWPLIQGRTDPFHRTIAAMHPALRPAILAEVERLEATREALVLGDCSPKNVIAYPSRSPLLLDFEVAHLGDPAFDVAYMLTHLSLKARHRPDDAPALRACAAEFHAAHTRAAADAAPEPAAVVAELGCLLLSRIDGKSPVEYLDGSDGEAVRAAAATLLLEPPGSVDDALELAFTQLVGTGEAP